MYSYCAFAISLLIVSLLLLDSSELQVQYTDMNLNNLISSYQKTILIIYSAISLILSKSNRHKLTAFRMNNKYVILTPPTPSNHPRNNQMQKIIENDNRLNLKFLPRSSSVVSEVTTMWMIHRINSRHCIVFDLFTHFDNRVPEKPRNSKLFKCCSSSMRCFPPPLYPHVLPLLWIYQIYRVTEEFWG